MADPGAARSPPSVRPRPLPLVGIGPRLPRAGGGAGASPPWGLSAAARSCAGWLGLGEAGAVPPAPCGSCRRAVPWGAHHRWAGPVGAGLQGAADPQGIVADWGPGQYLPGGPGREAPGGNPSGTVPALGQGSAASAKGCAPGPGPAPPRAAAARPQMGMCPASPA